MYIYVKINTPNKRLEHVGIILFNKTIGIEEMAKDEINQKVINIFKCHNSDLPLEDNDKIKFFAGYNYVKLKRDENGKKFIEPNLLAYAKKCHYIVRVMRKIDNDVCLYNYDIKNEDLVSFIKAFDNNVLNGTIIEIDKYFPEDLA